MSGPEDSSPTPRQAKPESPAAGQCHVMFAFDAGLGIDLTRAQQLLASGEREGLTAGGRNVGGADFHPRPVRVLRSVPSVELGDWRTSPICMVTLYDFGAISVSMTVPLERGIAECMPLARSLINNQTLKTVARAVAEEVIARAADAIARPRLSEQAEDYVVYALPSASTASVDRTLVARLLRAEQGPLSDEETADAFAHTVRYSPNDLAVIDWNAALLLDDDAAASIAVLEFANTELLEMRKLDDELDAALLEAYELSTRNLRRRRPFAPRVPADISRLAELQIDAATLFEAVNNALKLFGDQYLARLHSAATRRFHTDDYERSVLRKIDTLESIYSKVRDSQAQIRMEILEWIIILLIAFEVVMSFVR